MAVLVHRGPPSRSATFNRFYDDPETVDPADHRVDLCAAWSGPVAPSDAGVVVDTLAAARAPRITPGAR